jgi:ATP-dependent protease HslVU (ClpYQ) peptidase subunit
MLLAVTLVVGLQGKDGVVLASDSQATHGEVRQARAKLFKTHYGVIWGSAGPFAGAQDLFTTLEGLDLAPNPGREVMKAAIRKAMLSVADSATPAEGPTPQFEGLFAWYDGVDGRHYLLWARQDGHVEFERPFGAIGSGAVLGRFGFARSEFLKFDTLPLELTKMVTHMVAEEAVKASPKGVDLPIQLATVEGGDTQVLRAGEVNAIADTVSFFRESQRELLITHEPPAEEDEVGGLRPRPS